MMNSPGEAFYQYNPLTPMLETWSIPFRNMPLLAIPTQHATLAPITHPSTVTVSHGPH